MSSLSAQSTYIVAAIGFATALIGAITTYFSHKNGAKLNEIHLLVNNRLDETLRKVRELEQIVAALRRLPTDTRTQARDKNHADTLAHATVPDAEIHAVINSSPHDRTP